MWYVYMHNEILLSRKKNGTVLFAVPCEVSQTEPDKYHMVVLTCGMKNLIQKNIFIKQKWTHRHRK